MTSSKANLSRGIVALAAALLLVGAECPDGDEVRTSENAGLESDSVVDRDTFDDDPAAFEGESVTIAASVAEVVHPKAFSIESDDSNGDGYLVIHDGSTDVTVASRLEITGRVEDLDIGELEEELGADLDMPTFESYEGDYGIVADEIEVTDG